MNLFQDKITVLISILINHIDIRVQFVRVQFVELKDVHEFSLRNLSGFNQRTICQWPQGSCRESNYSSSTVYRNSEIVRTLDTKSKTEDQCLKWVFLDSVLRWVMVTRFGLCFNRFDEINKLFYKLNNNSNKWVIHFSYKWSI